MAKALLVILTAGLVWQFVLVAVLVRREQGTLRWSTVREALWLRSPRSPRSGRVGGRVWLILIPLIVVFAAHELIPPSRHPRATTSPTSSSRTPARLPERRLGLVRPHPRGASLFNTVLGEELLFRGFLLPRMNGAFGRGDWVANGVLFAGYHLHMPWAMPATLLDTFIIAYPTKRYRSAWIGIAVHSAQSVVFAVLLLTLVV